MRVGAVVINYRTPELTLRSLEALLPALERIEGGARTIVVENDSGDGSFEKLSEAVASRGWDDRVEVVRTDHNGGFGFGNNWAIRLFLGADDPPEYVYLLNSDAFPEPESVQALVDFLDAHPEAGIAGSRIHGSDDAHYAGYHHTAFRFNTVWSELEAAIGFGPVSRLLRSHIVTTPEPKESQTVDWLAGASMMLRSRMLEEMGGFDETFFMYFEETDLCLRARRAGWTVCYVVESRVAHMGSGSSGMVDMNKRTPWFWFDSRRYYYRKNHGSLYLWLCNAAYVAGASFCRLRKFLFPRQTNDRPHALGDFLRHTFGLGQPEQG